MCELRLQLPSFPHDPLSHQTSLIKNQFENKIIQNFKTMNAEPPGAGALLSMELHTKCTGCKPMNLALFRELFFHVVHAPSIIGFSGEKIETNERVAGLHEARA